MTGVTTATTQPQAQEVARHHARSGRPRESDRPRFLWVVTVAVMVYLFAPIVVVIVFSFNSARSLSVFQGFSLKWWEQLLHDADVKASLLASIEIGLAVMVFSCIIGTLLAIGTHSAPSRWRRLIDMLVMMALVAPEIATAVAAMLLFNQVGVTLSLKTVAVAHITFCIVFVTVIVRSRLAGIDESLEEAAMDLGASRVQALRLVILPLLQPAIMAGALITFVLSFDDFVTTFFTSGLGVSPMPMRIYGMLKFGISPVVNAVGTFMMLFTMSVVVIAALGIAWFGRRQQGPGRDAAGEAET
jgi:ABC-type spermidine/putrescine transport system permease subunit II